MISEVSHLVYVACNIFASTDLLISYSHIMCLSQLLEKNILEKSWKEGKRQKWFIAANCCADFKNLFPWIFFSLF